MKTLHRYLLYAVCFSFAMILTGCGKESKKIVAVSQCSMDEWRNQMNKEMEHEAFFHKNIEVEIHSTPDNTAQQIKDIESFIDRRVDGIVVAPNEWKPLRQVIEKAYDAGIPVVLIDRKVNSNKYTAFVGGDNKEVGRRAAQYILDKLPQGGNIIEMEGLASSTSSQERKEGLHEILDHHPEIHFVKDVVANWQRQKAFDVMDSIGPSIANVPVDIVFAYNDRMAIGAHQSLQKNMKNGRIKMSKLPLFIGVDALLDDTLGIGRIEDGTLQASFLYQTGGDKAIHTMANILDGKPYNRETIFETLLIDASNVHLLRLQANHIAEQDSKIEFLNGKLDEFFEQYNAQRIVSWTFIVISILVCVLLFMAVRMFIIKHRMNEKLRVANQELTNQRDALAEKKEEAERRRDELEAERDKLIEARLSAIERSQIAAENEKIEEEGMTPQDKMFVDQFKQVIESHMKDSEVTVDCLAAEMNLGRVQLYRRVKALMGKSPNEVLRITRLEAAKKLLLAGRHNISEAAYDVGFSSPSYFTKCYKDQFGKNPTDLLKVKR